MATDGQWPLYPDIQAAGGLGPALEAEFTRMGVKLDVQGFGAGGWASVKAGSRSSQVAIAVEERLFLPSFWSQGVGMGNGSSHDLAAVAEAIATWLTSVVPNRHAKCSSYDGAVRHDTNESDYFVRHSALVAPQP